MQNISFYSTWPIFTNLSSEQRKGVPESSDRPFLGRVRQTQQHSYDQMLPSLILNKEFTVNSYYFWGVGVRMTFIFIVFSVLQYRLNFYKEHGSYNVFPF